MYLSTIKFSNAFVTKAGMMKNNPRQFWQYRPDERHDYCIQYIIDGEGSFFTNGTLYPLKKGDLFIIPQTKEYYYKANPDNPYDYYWVHFNGSGFQNFLDYIGLSDESPVKHGLYDNEITKTFEELLKISNEKTNSNKLLILSLGYKILYLIASKITQKEETEGLLAETLCNDITNYMTEHFSEPISLDDIAKKFVLNKYYLLRLYKKTTGFTPIQFLIDYRIKCACELLKQGYSVNEAAYACGFNDIPNFSMRFKKKMNVSPNKFKKNMSANNQ